MGGKSNIPLAGRRTKGLPNTIWEGSFFDTHSMAVCNRIYVSALLRRNPDWKVGLFALGDDAVGGFEPLHERAYVPPEPVDVVVRMQYPPDFSPPPVGRLVAIQPWEYTSVPLNWVRHVNESLTELWTPTTFVRDAFVRSGCDPGKVYVVPHGIAPDTFAPEGPRYDLPTAKTFRFLFVGGTISRKGADVLLDAYLQEFGPEEDVCLVVKEFGAQSFYRGQGYGPQILAAMADPSAPDILYLTDELAPGAMPGLYRACDALVHPFRGEGFGLPIAEAMGCGLPVIVTNAGAPLDFVNRDVAYLIDAGTSLVPESTFGGYEFAFPPEVAEPDPEHLRQLMRRVFEQRDEARDVGRRAAAHMRAAHTWDHAAEVAERRLRELPRAAKGQPTGSRLTVLLARDLELRQKVGADLRLTERAIEANPHDPDLVAGHAKSLVNMGRWDEARSVLRQALERDQDAQAPLAQLCWMQSHSQQENEAFQLAQRAMGQGSDDYRLLAALKALYGHYTCIARSARIAKRQRAEAEPRAATVRTYLEQQGWDPASMEPLGTKLTLCMIVKNEEKHLPRCLESAKRVVDEIVIVDTGSTDRTVEIAKSYGAKVRSIPWPNDFSAARNESIRDATGDWILWLDADETLEPGGVKVIQEALVRPQFGGYMMQIVNFLSDNSTDDVFTHRPCRLFRRIPGLEFTGKVHEQILPSIERAGLLAANLAGARIFHYGYAQSAMSERGKLERTLQLIEEELKTDPDNPFHQFNLANTLYVAGRWEESARMFERCAPRTHEKQDYCSTAYHLWAAALVNLKRGGEALAVCREADERGIRSPAIEFSRAGAHYLRQEFEEALRAVRTARELPWEDKTTGDFSVTTHKLSLVEGQALLGLGRVPEAIEALKSSLAASPNYTLAHYFLGSAYARSGRAKEALPHLERAFDEPQVGDAAALIAAEMQFRTGRTLQAARSASRVAKAHPEDESAWLRWLYYAEQSQDWNEVNAAYSFRAEHAELTSDMYVNWGRAATTMQDWASALDHFKGAIQTDPVSSNAFFNAGDCLYRLGAFQEAAEAYQTGLQLEPTNVEGWFVLGNALFQLRMFEGAKLAYEQVLRFTPEHEGARNNLTMAREAIRATAA